MKAKVVRGAVTALAVAALMAAGAGRSAAAQGAKWVEGQVIVRFAPGVSMSTLATKAHSSAWLRRTMRGRRLTALINFSKSVPVQQMVAQFKSMPGVVYAEPNYIATIPAVVEDGAGDATGDSTVVERRLRQASSGEIRSKSFPSSLVREMNIFPSDTLLTAGCTPNATCGQPDWFFIGADQIWPEALAGAVVAVLDTGVDYKHPDLALQVVKGQNVIAASLDPLDDNGHGTHVTGTVTARIDNKLGIAGVTKSKVLSIKVLDAVGSGTYFDIAQGIISAANNLTVKVLSMSLGGSADSTTLKNAVDYAVNTKGKLIVAAAGNDNGAVPEWPGFYANQCDGVACPKLFHVNCTDLVAPASTECPSYPQFKDKLLAVAAQLGNNTTTSQCRLNNLGASSSNWGDWVQIAAPGRSILSTTPTTESYLFNPLNGIYRRISGTSMATPHVAGAASRVWSLKLTQTNVQVAQKLVASGFSTQAAGLQNGACWPNAAQGQNNDIVLLQVPQAMDRSIIWGYAMDAMSVNGLFGGEVKAYTPSGLIKGVSSKIVNGDYGYYEVLNVPYSPDDPANPPHPLPYKVRVNKLGFTALFQAFGTVSVGNKAVGACAPEGCAPQVSVPSNKFMGVVTDYGNWFCNIQYGAYPFSSYYGLDQFVYLPSDKPYIVGNPVAAPLATPASSPNDIGTLLVSPFARFMYDGGYPVAPLYLGDQTNHETTVLKAPLLSTAVGKYQVFVRDYGASPNQCAGSTDLVESRPTVRYWKFGVLKNTVQFIPSNPNFANCSFNGGLDACRFWHVGDIDSLGVFTAVDLAGNGTSSAPVPYARSGRVGFGPVLKPD